MADLITGLIEAFVGLLGVLAEAIPVIIEAFIEVVVVVGTILAYALSRKFRARKNQEWNSCPGRKYFDLGVSVACLCLIAGLVTWITIAELRPSPSKSVVSTEPRHDGQTRLTFTRYSDNGSNQLNIAVKPGGIDRIVHTKSLHELKEALRDNVTSVEFKTEHTNNSPTTLPRR